MAAYRLTADEHGHTRLEPMDLFNWPFENGPGEFKGVGGAIQKQDIGHAIGETECEAVPNEEGPERVAHRCDEEAHARHHSSARRRQGRTRAKHRGRGQNAGSEASDRQCIAET